LVVHNLYRSEAGPSGENQVVDDEVALLRDAGVQVETYFRSSDEIRSLKRARRAELALRSIYSRSDAKGVGDVLDSFQPDVVHLHNPFPLISPWVIRTAKARGIPVVQTVHNYRHVCAQGAFFRDGQPCDDCSGRVVPWPSVLHGCYRGSRPQSVVMATATTIHRPTWRLVDRFLPPSSFASEHLVRAGIPREKIIVKPNCIADPGPVKPLGAGFLFVGRLAPDKGVSLALDAWSASGLGSVSRLVVAGDGEERNLVEAAATQLPGLEYVGRVNHDQVEQLLDECAVAIVPSLCAESFGRFSVEAFAHGRAVVASDLGASVEIVSDERGWRAATRAEAFAKQMIAAFDRPVAERKGLAARAHFEVSYTNDRVLEILLDTYRSLASRRPEDCERSTLV
jgi:glycosyltransferase involved in cell wall biosynthesis